MGEADPWAEFPRLVTRAETYLDMAAEDFGNHDFRAAVRNLGTAERLTNQAKVIADDMKRKEMKARG